MRGLPVFFPGQDSLSTVTQVIWVIQLALLIHMYRTGRPYWWTWVLLGAPVIGGLAYFIVEIAPELRAPRGRSFFYSLKPRKWRIADLRTAVEEGDSVDNRLALAEELYNGGLKQEAHDVATECLKGVFSNDPHTLVDVARYKIGIKRYDEALGLLDRVDTKADRMLALEVALLRGDSTLALGRNEEAEHFYRSVEGKYVGDAPRFGIASVMEKTGRRDQAEAIWKDIRVHYRKASPAWRRSEKKWYKLATAKLGEQKA
jgi:hypothetical protein